MAFQLLE